MVERTPKNNKESSKSEREHNLAYLVRYLTGDRPDWVDEQLAQHMSDRAEEIFVDLTREEQDQLWRLVQHEELQLVQRNLERAREHLHDIIIGGIRERIRERRRREAEVEFLERERRRGLYRPFSQVNLEVAREEQIRELEIEKAKQRALEQDLLLAKQRQEGSRSNPPDETILPSLISALFFDD